MTTDEYQCGDECNGECSGEVDGVVHCPLNIRKDSERLDYLEDTIAGMQADLMLCSYYLHIIKCQLQWKNNFKRFV